MIQSLISLNTLIESIDSKSIIIYLEGNETLSHLCVSLSKMNVTFEDVYLGLKSSEGVLNIDFNTITSIEKINKNKFKIHTDELSFIIQVG